MLFPARENQRIALLCKMAMREQLLPAPDTNEGDAGNGEKANEAERTRADDLKFDL